jgi:hypothetical protein
MRELCRLIGATQNMSTAYHPRTDGQSERSNQWLGQYLRPWVNVQMDNWEEHLPIAEFAHNSWKNETTHYSPFKMLMGYEPRAEISDAPTPIPILELRRETWKRVRKEAEKHIIQAQQRWAQSKKEGRTFKEGEYVWLEGRNLHLDVPSNKLAPKRHGPFPIKRVLSPITYQLTLPGTWKIHDVFHVDCHGLDCAYQLLQIIIGTALVLILSHSPSLCVTLLSDDSRTCDRLDSMAFHDVLFLGPVY